MLFVRNTKRGGWLIRLKRKKLSDEGAEGQQRLLRKRCPLSLFDGGVAQWQSTRLITAGSRVQIPAPPLIPTPHLRER